MKISDYLFSNSAHTWTARFEDGSTWQATGYYKDYLTSRGTHYLTGSCVFPSSFFYLSHRCRHSLSSRFFFFSSQNLFTCQSSPLIYIQTAEKIKAGSFGHISASLPLTILPSFPSLFPSTTYNMIIIWMFLISCGLLAAHQLVARCQTSVQFHE